MLNYVYILVLRGLCDMSETIHYYNCFLSHNDNFTNVGLEDFLDRIITLDSAKRFKILRSGQMSMMQMAAMPNNPYISARDRMISIGKYRDNKPYLGNKGTDRADEINDDVLEMTTAYFVPGSYMVLVQYNHYGARPFHLVEYFNSFLPLESDDVWRFELIPIDSDKGFNDVKNSSDIKSIEIRLDVLSASRQNIVLPQSILGNIIGKSIETNSEFGANVATIGFSNGRFRKNVIEPVKLVNLLEALDLENDLFEHVKVRYVSPSSGKLETVDLKNEGIMKRVILEGQESGGWEFIGNCIRDDFYSNNKPKNTEFTTYPIEPDDLPPLSITIEE